MYVHTWHISMHTARLPYKETAVGLWWSILVGKLWALGFRLQIKGLCLGYRSYDSRRGLRCLYSILDIG